MATRRLKLRPLTKPPFEKVHTPDFCWFGAVFLERNRSPLLRTVLQGATCDVHVWTSRLFLYVAFSATAHVEIAPNIYLHRVMRGFETVKTGALKFSPHDPKLLMCLENLSSRNIAGGRDVLCELAYRAWNDNLAMCLPCVFSQHSAELVLTFYSDQSVTRTWVSVLHPTVCGIDHH